ncbi:hypothetical protein QBC32DRAFT_348803 [Pseudoneurospora amorphoporcata]|uniref:Uncharacterized protein n=1 Tax=Pseudoneurospora amorphoporcata TaxID=241081 RepID=A0AAN6NPB1_9PEZI|nr:hypothetical protein QBC32DRAFT_348803 [Pseudoneurospora amorphoporcata]
MTRFTTLLANAAILFMLSTAGHVHVVHAECQNLRVDCGWSLMHSGSATEEDIRDALIRANQPTDPTHMYDSTFACEVVHDGSVSVWVSAFQKWCGGPNTCGAYSNEFGSFEGCLADESS